MKIMSALLIAAALLISCIILVTLIPSPQPNVEGGNDDTIESVLSGITCREVLANFEELVPSGDYQITRLAKVNLDDGKVCQPVVITETIAGKTYHIHLYSSAAGDMYMFSLMTTQGKYTELDFALLSFWLYESLNLPAMDAQNFYDHFSLISKEPDGYLTTDGWWLSVHTSDEYLLFSGSFN